MSFRPLAGKGLSRTEKKIIVPSREIVTRFRPLAGKGLSRTKVGRFAFVQVNRGFRPLAGKGLSRTPLPAAPGGVGQSVSVPLRGKGCPGPCPQGAVTKDGQVNQSFRPLAGKGLSRTLRTSWKQWRNFRERCFRPLAGKGLSRTLLESTGFAQTIEFEFPSPCGERVVPDSQLLNDRFRKGTGVSVPLRGKGCPGQQWSALPRGRWFSRVSVPLRGKGCPGPQELYKY